MPINFTFRDFFAYLLVGIISISSFAVLYIDEIICCISKLFITYPFLIDISFFTAIFLLPIIYFIGQLVGFCSFFLLQLYVKIYKFWRKDGKNIPPSQYKILKFFEKILYRYRNIYAIIQHTKNKSTINFTNKSDFWYWCNLLQIKGCFNPAQYWFALNEFYSSMNLVFFIAAIFAVLKCKYILFIIYVLLMVICTIRAKKYAEHFVDTVNNLITIYKDEIKKD